MPGEKKIAWWRELSSYQWLVLLVAWLGWVFDIMDTALFTYAKTPMLIEFMGEAAYKATGANVEGRIQTLFLLGWALGGLLFGLMADRIGRTKTLIFTILIYCALTGLTALCQTVEQVTVIRFLTGLGIGGEWAAGAALVAEVLPNRTRAAAASVLQTAAAIGPVLAVLTYHFLGSHSWRWLFVVGVLPALITVVIRLKVKEPEKWTSSEHKPSSWALLAELFKTPQWRRNAILAMLIGIVGIAGANTISYWLPNLVRSASTGLPEAEIVARIVNASYLMYAGTFLGVLVFPSLCNHIGRKWALATFFVFSPASILIAITVGKDYNHLLLLLPLVSFCVIGLTAGYALYFPELFPTRFRGTGLGLAYNTARIATASVPFITGALISKYQSVGAGIGFTALIYLVGIVVMVFAPETKGQPLPE